MGYMLFRPVRTKENKLSLPKINFNKNAFYILCEIMFLKTFTWNIFPNID